MMGIFQRSIGIRHLVCGSCNGCEHEMNALAGPDYDITQNGWDIVASPRHADVITVTGPMVDAMRSAASRTLEAVPDPKVVVAIGDCAAGCGVFAGTSGVGAGAGGELGATIVVPGCPPTPSMIKEGLLLAAQALSDLVKPSRGSDVDQTKMDATIVSARQVRTT
jgi:Ni,Fe-hydrogenase III small subunit